MWCWDLGLDRLGLWVDGSGLGAQLIVLGHGGLESGIAGGDMGVGDQILVFGDLIGPGHKKIAEIVGGQTEQKKITERARTRKQARKTNIVHATTYLHSYFILGTENMSLWGQFAWPNIPANKHKKR